MERPKFETNGCMRRISRPSHSIVTLCFPSTVMRCRSCKHEASIDLDTVDDLIAGTPRRVLLR